MSDLRLSPEWEALYNKLSAKNEEEKQEAIKNGDARAAKKCRQHQSALYSEFYFLQLPPEPPDKHEREDALTIEQRLDRIEAALKIGRHAEDF